MKAHLFKAYLFLTSILCNISVLAQSVCQIQEFSSDDGVAQRNVSNIIQDNKGFIWFATWNGLGKFDGHDFKNYRISAINEDVLQSNRIQSLHLDQNNDIWCRFEGDRAFLFDIQKETFTDILKDIEQKTGKTFSVEDICPLSNGTVWIICKKEVFRLSKDKNSSDFSICMKELSGTKVFRIRADADGNEWIFTSAGTRIIGSRTINDTITPFINMHEKGESIYLISHKGHFVRYDKNESSEKNVQSIDIPHSYPAPTRLLGADETHIYMGTGSGLLIYTFSTQTIEYVNFNEYTRNIQNIYKDSYGELWLLCQESGIIHYAPQTGEKRRLQTPKQGIPQAELSNYNLIFEDKQKTLWMIPNDGGFCYYDRKEKQLKPYYQKVGSIRMPYTPIIYSSFYDGHNNLWFSDRQQISKITFYPDACQFHAIDPGYETRTFFKDQDNNLWVASKRGYVRLYSPDKSLLGYLSPDGRIVNSPTSFNNNIYCFMQDTEGNIWLGSRKEGLFVLKKKSPKHFQITRHTHDTDNPYSLSNNSIYSIYQDKQQRIWVGTYGGGINLLTQSKDGSVRFRHHENTPNIPLGRFDKIRAIKGIDDYLFFGSKNGLLTCSSLFNSPEDITFHANIHRPNDSSSLSSNDVMNIFHDSSNNIYVLTFSGGINQITDKNILNDRIVFQRHTQATGLPSDLIYAMIEDHEGSLWVVAENALFRFVPQNNSYENYLGKHLQQIIYFSESNPIIWNKHLLIGTLGGYMEITPSLLQSSNYFPPVVLTDLYIQGEKQDTAIDNMQTLELTPNQRNISIHFTTPDYADPASIKYSYRLRGLEDNWSHASDNRQARYINLPPGNYEFQVKSTNSDEIWSDTYKTLNIHVTPTFWETGWAILLYALLFILFTFLCVYIFYIIYRLRHRVFLEKQITHIKLRFFTDISHELRTPLTLITSPVSEVLEHEPLSPKARKHLELVHHNAELMIQLVNQILDFRKIENQKMKLLLEHTEIVSTLRGIMKSFSLMAEKKQINFSLQKEVDELYVWVDQDKLQKIILNLLSNAFKYTPDRKSITIILQTDTNHFTIRIKDEGNGISEEKLPLLFERFETLAKDNILQPSSGIGLSLVKELVELHLGSIHVESRTGVGSEFTIRLPLHKEMYESIDYKEFILDDSRSVAPLEDNQDTSTPAQEDAMSILIVEDNDDLRRLLKDILSDTYKVMEASNGKEGLELAQQQVPDFIISDIMMPVMDGIEMVKAIKADRNICHIPIILLTAKSSLDDQISGLEQGIDDYIIKPFSSTYVKTRIHSLLQQRKELQQRYMKQYTASLPEKKDYLQPEEVEITSFDEQFMQRVKAIVEEHMDDTEFTIEQFAQEAGLGRTIFYQKTKSITGMPPIDLLQTIRIKRAIQLMDNGIQNVSSVAYMCGFNDPKYFSKCFKKHMGISPTEYYKKKE